MATTAELPSNQDYDGGGRNPWRIAEGKLKRGRAEDQNLEERDHIVGLLHNVFIKEGTSDEGAPYQYVAALLENVEDGKFVVHASTSSKTASGTFASALLLTEGGEIISITPNLGSKPIGPAGRQSKPTYTNLKVKTAKGWEELRNDTFYPIEDAVALVRQLPHFTEQEKEPDADDVYGQFSAYVVKRGWFDPEKHEQYSAAWLIVANKILKANKAPEISGWDELSEGHLAKLTEALDKQKECPKTVTEVDIFEDAPVDPLADL